MPKTIFHSTENSNFILNMDLERYRNACRKLLMLMLMLVAGSMLIYQITYSVNDDLATLMGKPGFSSVLSLLLVTLRSISTLFSIAGVLAIIAMVIGMMRKQFPASAIVPYLLVLAGLLWAIPTIFRSFDTEMALFGQNGRDEGAIALLMYGAVFYLGSMLRRTASIQKFLNWVLGFGLVQCVWGLLQAQPWFAFPNEYRMVEPLLYQDLRLPAGLTDSPVAFAMLLGMLLAVAVAVAMCSDCKRQRIFAAVCAGCFVVLLWKTQTIAGCLGAGLGLLLAAILWIKHRKHQRIWVTPLVVCAASVLALGWVYVTPSLNHAYVTASDTALENGFAVYDGGLVWDDGFYRIGTAGPYSAAAEHDFDIHDTSSVISYCWKEASRVIGKYPLVGTGPDNFSYSQLKSSLVLEYNTNSIDRPYNDFLYVAATRGIPALLLYLALLVVCIRTGIRTRKQTGQWYYTAALYGVLGFLLTSVVGVSVLTVSPLFWMLLGMLVTTPLPESETP